MNRILCSALLVSQVTLSALQAQSSAVGGGGKALQVRLLSDHSVVAPGKSFWIGVEVVHPKGWHTYWTNSGGFGVPMKLKFELPPGVKSGPVIWALPHVVDGGAVGLSYDRSETTMDLVEITPATDFAVGQEMEISAEVISQLCNDETCLPPQSTKVSLKLKTGPNPVADATAEKALAPAKAAAPVTLPDWKVSVKGCTITVTPTEKAKQDVGSVQYLNFTDDVESQPVSVKKEGGAWQITLKESTPGAVPAGVLIASKGWNEAGIKALIVGSR